MTIQNKNIVKISDEYGLGADDMNLILYQLKTNSSEKSKNFGKQYYHPIGYYSSVESMLKNLVNKKVMLSVSEEQSLKDVVTAVDNGVDKLYASVLEVVKHIKWTS